MAGFHGTDPLKDNLVMPNLITIMINSALMCWLKMAGSHGTDPLKDSLVVPNLITIMINSALKNFIAESVTTQRGVVI
jgi:hypothetical protein